MSSSFAISALLNPHDDNALTDFAPRWSPRFRTKIWASNASEREIGTFAFPPGAFISENLLTAILLLQRRSRPLKAPAAKAAALPLVESEVSELTGLFGGAGRTQTVDREFRKTGFLNRVCKFDSCRGMPLPSSKWLAFARVGSALRFHSRRCALSAHASQGRPSVAAGTGLNEQEHDGRGRACSRASRANALSVCQSDRSDSPGIARVRPSAAARGSAPAADRGPRPRGSPGRRDAATGSCLRSG